MDQNKPDKLVAKVHSHTNDITNDWIAIRDSKEPTPDLTRLRNAIHEASCHLAHLQTEIERRIQK